MERQYIESSMILSIGYDSSTSTLEVEFKKNGAIWQYYDVLENTYYEFINSSSVGRYFLQNIKGQYSESQIG